MKTIIALIGLALSVIIFCGCKAQSVMVRRSISNPVYIAVNLGEAHHRDLFKLEAELGHAGIPCTHTATSLRATDLAVEREDFDRVKPLLERFVIRDKLSVRIYKSPYSVNSSVNPLLEVWENGKKTREEYYRIY
jgi:hypothetical protein